jgi:hypothetical protein
MRSFLKFALFFCLQPLLLVAALATSGDDSLITKLPKDLRNAAKVAEKPLVQATKDAVKETRSLAPQITAAAMLRATDCASAEAVLRAALGALAPEPTAKEFLSVTRAAIRAAPRDQSSYINKNGYRAYSGNCTETLLAAAASTYPNLAWVLSESGKQVADGKQLARKHGQGGNGSPNETGNQTPGQGQGMGSSPGTGNQPGGLVGQGQGPGQGQGFGLGNSPYDPGQGLGAILAPPGVTFPPSGGGLVSTTTPITAGQ